MMLAWFAILAAAMIVAAGLVLLIVLLAFRKRKSRGFDVLPGPGDKS